MMQSLELAQNLRSHGVAPIAVRVGEKHPPMLWTQYQIQGPSEHALTQWLTRDGYTVAALCGVPSGNLVVLESDDRQLFENTLTRLGNPRTWITQGTDRGGAVWIRTPEPASSARIGMLEIRSQGSVMMAPGAQHPNPSVRYHFLNPRGFDDPIWAIPGLNTIPWLPLQPAVIRLRVPELARRILTGEPINRGYPSRSEAECAAVASMIRNGFDYWAVLEEFCKSAHDGTKFAELYAHKPKEAERWLKHTFEQVDEYLQTHETDPHRIARELLEWAEQADWAGNAGDYDRAVYMAHCKIAMRCACIEYAASIRDLSLLAGVSLHGASSASARLEHRGLIKRLKKGTAELATVWELIPEPPQKGCCTRVHFVGQSNRDEAREYATPPASAHDAFWRVSGGLGKSGEQIWAVIRGAGALRASEIAARTGRNKTTVLRLLGRMLGVGMVDCDVTANGGLWKAREKVDLNEVAHQLETLGRHATRQQAYKAQREGHRAALRFRRNQAMAAVGESAEVHSG